MDEADTVAELKSKPRGKGGKGADKSKRKGSSRGETRRSSRSGQQGVNLEPTYRMEPKRCLEVSPVREVIQTTLESELGDFQYSWRVASLKSKVMADKIRDLLKVLDYDRYKYVVWVCFSENVQQSLSVGSRCLWDNRYDRSVNCNFLGDNFVCIVVLFAGYQS